MTSISNFTPKKTIKVFFLRKILLINALASSLLLSAAGPVRADTFAIFFALDADLMALKGKESVGARTVSIGSTSVQGFNIGPHKVWAVKMGAGNVETAIHSMVLLSKFPCDMAISIGPAGALSSDVKIGQWYGIRKMIGYQRGTFDTSGWQISPTATTTLPIHPLVSEKISKEWKISGEISIASGDAFIAQDAENARLAEITGASAVDMNSYGLVSACASMKTPLIMWKIISDRADIHAGEDFRKFIAAYDGEGGRQVRRLLLQLVSTPNSPEAYENIRKLLTP